MAGKLDDLDYYTLIGVDDRATLAEIKSAFRKFGRRYHPDRFAGQPPEKVEKAAQIYRRGSEAYVVLTDERTRKAYDAALRQGKLRLSLEEQSAATRDVAAAPKKKKQPIKSPQALAYFKQGIEAAHDGDYRTCWRFLKMALDAEPGNEFIAKRFYQVDRRLRGF